MLKIQSDYLSVVFVYDSDFLESEVINNDKVLEDEYRHLVKNVITAIDDALYLTTTLGDLKPTFLGGKGYDMKNEFGNSGVTISYHSRRPEMGLLLQMSGNALHTFKALYLQDFGELLEVNSILRILNNCISSDIGFFRLSRFDAAIDFIDENIDLTTLYAGLENEHIRIYNYKENRNMSGYKAYTAGKNVETVYIGSRQSNNMLRIYNKKTQVIERNVTKDLEQAINCKDWFRFEMEIKKESAHVLTDILMNIETIEEFKSYLIQLISDKYRFATVADDEIEYIEITQKMLDAIEYQDTEIVIPRKNREFDLRKSEEYFQVGNSGLQSLVYKQMALFGEDYVRDFFEQVIEHNKTDYTPSIETVRYVRELREERELERRKNETK